MADEKMERQKVKEITDKLEAGLKELSRSEKYKSYLSTMSKFHNYSVNNTMLIAMQKPEATLVAGYKAWQKNFERHVNFGEKAIRILAPAPYKIKEERDKLDPVTGEMMFDENGMPQKEEVERTIPAFRAVSVFDVSQTDGKPLPELEATELWKSVEGYEDFVQALMNVAPVPIGFEDIPGVAKGYYQMEEKRIAIQENMSESQTLKTMIHETAHSMLHKKEVDRDDVLEALVKDRNTKEVEAESIAYTVCQHFEIDTSDYSFGYIAGWSSGKDMKELKSSLDTIRRTASELITGIEEQLQALEQDRELLQAAEKESVLLVQNNDLSEYSLLNVRGMDTKDLVAALSDMTEDDKLSVQAYLESRGAWTTELGNERSEEVEEYHLDVRYNVDTDEVIDVSRTDNDKRVKEPILPDDVIIKMIYEDGKQFEIDRILNKTPEEMESIMEDLLLRVDSEWDSDVEKYLADHGVEYVPIMFSFKEDTLIPEFYDYQLDLEKEEITSSRELSLMKQAEGIINRMEYAATKFTADERNLIVNYAYKLGDIDKTKELAEKLAFMEENSPNNVALTVIDAQAEIDALPDPMIGISEMLNYGYTWGEMLPLTQERALELFDHDIPVYLLHEDGSETTVENRKQLTEHEGIFGIEKGDWENEKALRSMQEELSESAANREAQLLYGSTDKYGIYQLKKTPELDSLRFEGTESLKRMGIIKNNLDAIKPENYELVYTGELKEFEGQTSGEMLEAIYTKFNIDHPEDFRGHSLSVSDVVVLHQDGENTANFVDSFGFTGLPDFMRELENVPEQDTFGHNVQKSEQDTLGHNVQKSAAELQEPENGDEMIDLGDEMEQVLSEMKQSLKPEIEETELAFQLADRYISIQTVEGGYDYSIMGEDYKELDGGVYDNPNISIREALNEIVLDLKQFEAYETLRGSIKAEDELQPIDYDGLMEKVEAANRIEPQSSVVGEFRAKTNELFHDISELNAAEVEETVKCHVQAKIDEYGIDAVIVDAVVTGSRCRGLEQEGSDLDVVVELSTKEREDDLFNAFNEDGLHIGDVRVDINPITAQRTGTLETYLPQAEEYLAGVKAAREQDTLGHNVQKSEQEAEVTLTVAECSEFHNMGEFHDNIPTVEEAVAIWKQIPPERMNGIPAIGIHIHKPGEEVYQDTEMDILMGKHIDLEILEYVPDIANNPKAIAMIGQIIEQLPDMEVRGSLEKWLPEESEVDRIAELAAAIDQFAYDFDTYEYKDTVDDREAQIESIAEDIRNGNTVYLSDFLNAAISNEIKYGIADIFGQGKDIADSESVQNARKAKELLDKLAEYKPLAKIEEQEEQNYNMVDNVLNNGAGEKAEKEERKKEQAVVKPSLKARLAQKQAQVAGQGKACEEQENTKKNQREM